MMAPDPFKTTPRFEKIAFSCQDDPLPTRIANSSSTKVVNFSSARTTKRFPLCRCASAIQIVALESIAETQPQLQPAFLRLLAISSCSHDFTYIRAVLRQNFSRP